MPSAVDALTLLWYNPSYIDYTAYASAHSVVVMYYNLHSLFILCSTIVFNITQYHTPKSIHSFIYLHYISPILPLSTIQYAYWKVWNRSSAPRVIHQASYNNTLKTRDSASKMANNFLPNHFMFMREIFSLCRLGSLNATSSTNRNFREVWPKWINVAPARERLKQSI